MAKHKKQKKASGAFEARINDGRKVWKLSDMDLKSYSRGYGYSRSRDAMFQASDSQYAPWYMAISNEKRRTRLIIISDIPGRMPYESMPRKKATLPSPQKPEGYVEPDYPYRYIAETF